MTRPIDADALKEWFPDNGEGSWTYNVIVKACIDAQPTVEVTDKEDFPEGFFEKPRRHATEEKGFDEKTCIPVTIHYAEPVDAVPVVMIEGRINDLKKMLIDIDSDEVDNIWHLRTEIDALTELLEMWAKRREE